MKYEGCCIADGPNNFNCYACPPDMEVIVNSTYYCSVPFTKTVIPSNQKDNSVAKFLGIFNPLLMYFTV